MVAEGSSGQTVTDAQSEVRVLVVDDDPDLRDTTRAVLERHGFVVTVAADGIEALEQVRANAPDIAVVDVVMPRMDGLALTRLLAAETEVPVILLTARDLPSDEVHGLEIGAVDYVRKPFDGEVLAARIRVAMRRRSSTASGEQGPVAIDRRAMAVTVDGSPVSLTVTEYRLLVTFFEHAGAVLSRRQLLEQVWGDDEWAAERIVDVNVQRLRTKVGADRIETVRGAGYRFVQ
jgi:DNA-binding response OmpR family regulator